MVAFLSAATNWLLFAALVAALGSVAARWIFIPRAASSYPEATPSLGETAARLGSWGGWLLPVAMAMVLGRQLYEFRDPFSPWADEAGLLLSTDWGATWTMAAGISVAGAVGFVLVRRGIDAGWWVGALGVLPLAAYPAFSGHASGTEALRAYTITADVLHVLSAGAWVGGLTFVLLAERRWRAERSGDDSLLPTLVPVFSPVALVAVGTLILTGSFASWAHIENFGEMLTTPYGRLLSLKSLAVTVVMTLGAINWRRLTPLLGEPRGQAAMRRNAAAELLLAQVVLVITAVLVRTSPMSP